MARKIEGLAVQLDNRKWKLSEDKGAPMAIEQRATLVISDERVFTESEVKAILEGMCVIPRFIGNSILTRDLEQALRSVAEQSGIVLDPVQPTNP